MYKTDKNIRNMPQKYNFNKNYLIFIFMFRLDWKEISIEKDKSSTPPNFSL